MKYLILGAGPAGLAFANCLRRAGENSFLILEKERESGGLCRSVEVDGFPMDIGGGHFLDVRRPEVTAFLFEFLPRSEWNLFVRDSRILFHGAEIGHPIEANIWQMEEQDQEAYLKSIKEAGCNRGLYMPELFTDWIYWKLGKRIAEDYMLPYNRKLFGMELDELGTYWLEKLPKVSYEETLLSCRTKTAHGSHAGHARFYYPKNYGYGEVWKRMADAVGRHVVYGAAVKALDAEKRTVTAADGKKYGADVIITTIPWHEFTEIEGMPGELLEKTRRLKHNSIVTRYYSKDLDTKAQWLYDPDPQKSYHRMLVRTNFCPQSRGFWTETNSRRTELLSAEERKNIHFENAYAYPLNTKEKPEIMGGLLEWARERGIFGLGRWGEHGHFNSDETVERAMRLAEDFLAARI